MRIILFYIIDLITVALCAYAAYFVRENLEISGMWLAEFGPYSLISGITVATGMLAFGGYRNVWKYISSEDLIPIIKAVTVGLSIAIILVFTINRLDHVARSVPIIHWGISIAALTGLRLLFREAQRNDGVAGQSKSGHKPHYALVVGMNQITDSYLRYASQFSGRPVSIAGLLVDEPDLIDRKIRSVSVLGSLDDLPRVLARCKMHGIVVDTLVITTPFDKLSTKVQRLFQDYENRALLKVERLGDRIIPEPASQEIEAQKPTPNGRVVNSRQVRDFLDDNATGKEFPFSYSFAKRALDIVGAFTALLLLSPLILLLTLLVGFNVGWPPIFWQERPGRYARPFRVLKFKTMRMACDDQGTLLPDEQRITRIGSLLRRTRLDELPQLLNILSGDMSLVGPRPLLPVDQPDNMLLRLSARPGLTGLAQINGGKDLSREAKTELDIWYAQNANLALDLKILAKTAYYLIRGNVANETRSEHDAAKARYDARPVIEAEAGNRHAGRDLFN